MIVIRSMSHLAGDDIAEQLPAFAIELHQLHLLDRKEIVRAGVDLDPRQQHIDGKILQVCGLLHHILARKIVTALFQNLDHGLRRRIAVDVVVVGLVAVREILVHEGCPGLDPGIVLPRRIGRILQIGGRNDALGIVEAGWLENGCDRCRHVAEKIHRLPAEFADLSDRLRRPLWRGPRYEDIVARVFQRNDLRVDGGIADLIGLVGDDHAGLITEPVAQPLHLILAGVVVLPERSDLSVRMVLQDVLRVDAPLALVVGLPAHGPRKILRIAPLGRTGRDEELRHFLGVHVFLGGRIGLGPERLEDQQDFITLHQLARLLYGFRRTEGVVVADEGDLAAVDAAFGVDLVEIGCLGLPDHAIGGCRTAIRHDIADFDFGVARARIIFLLRIRRGRGHRGGCGKCRKRNKASDTSQHRSLPFNLFCSSLAHRARAFKHQLVPRRKTALLRAADYDQFPQTLQPFEAHGLGKPAIRIGPGNPRIAEAAYRLTRWLSEPPLARRGFHRIGSEVASRKIASIRDRLQRGETVYIAGLAGPGTHNSGIALIEVTQSAGPRIIVNNEEERFSGNKHETEYPQLSIDAMVGTLRQMGRNVGDIAAFVTTWDYPALLATMVRTVLEEAPGSLKLLTMPIVPAIDLRRLDKVRRLPRTLATQLGLPEPVPLICMPHHDNHAWFSFAASPFADSSEPVAVAVIDGTGDQGSISLYVANDGAMRRLYRNDSVFDSLGAFYSTISSTH